MLDCDKIVGIDLARMDGECAVYAIYESSDGGNEWMPLLESRKIYDLLDYAKARYGNETPMVMQQHIQDILLVQIIEEAKHTKKASTAPADTSTQKKWFRRLLDFFKRE